MFEFPADCRKYIENAAAAAISRAQDQGLGAIMPLDSDRWPGFVFVGTNASGPGSLAFQHQDQSPRRAAAACVDVMIRWGSVRFLENGGRGPVAASRRAAGATQLGLGV
jgi:hypothetical protein